MILCTLNSSRFEAFFGKPEAPIARTTAVQIIGQKQDCSSFLLLAAVADPLLDVQAAVPAGYDFTYCQSWGLTINADVVNRVVADLRIKAYPPVGDQLDAIWKGGVDFDAMKVQVTAVKAKYPKP